MSFLKVVEGFGLVAGLNKSNNKTEYVGGNIVETEYSCRERIYHFTLFDAYQEVIDYLRAYSSKVRRKKTVDTVVGPYFYNMEKVRDIDIISDYVEGNGEGTFFGTIEQYEAGKHEQKRLELEQLAKEFAASKKIKLSSLEFIKAIKEEIEEVNDEKESWNNYEVRAEEWAACQYSGGGSDVYYDDLNYMNGKYSGQISDFYDILEWLREECPLLMCKYEESLLQ